MHEWYTVRLPTRGGGSIRSTTYALVFGSLLLIFHMLLRSGQLLRWQALAVMMTATAPWLVHILQNAFGILPLQNISLTPYAVAITGPILAWSFYRLRVRDIVPVAVIRSWRASRMPSSSWIARTGCWI